jgi:signal peptidase I
MADTIIAGDHVLADNRAYAGGRMPQRGDIVTFLYPEDRSRLFLKRVIGLPGEQVEIRDRVVHIDGRPLTEAYAKHIRSEPEPLLEAWGPELVPPDAVFLLGDNRDNSRDSRFWGHVPFDDLRGRAFLTYWSQDPRTGVIHWGQMGRDLTPLKR